MSDIEKVAENVLGNVLKLRFGETVTIETWTHNLSDANAFALVARRMGAHPLVVHEDEPTYWKSVKTANPEALGAFPKHEEALLKASDAYVFLYGPARESARQRLGLRALARLEGYNKEWYRVAQKANVRFARLELGRVSDDRARFFGVSSRAWRREVLLASAVPPSSLSQNAARLSRPLLRGEELRIQHPNGTDLRLGLKGREPVIDDGDRCARGGNFVHILPAGSMVLAVDEAVGEGRFDSNVRIHGSVGSPDGGSWTLSGGRLTGFDYRMGKQRFATALGRAGIEGTRPGLIGFGLNPKVDRAPRCEDERLGNILFSIGGNKTEGGANRGRWASHLLLRDPTVTIDGATVMRAGRVTA
jgi:leucyl aminopeptidase (aminopeptidase T)